MFISGYANTGKKFSNASTTRENITKKIILLIKTYLPTALNWQWHFSTDKSKLTFWKSGGGVFTIVYLYVTQPFLHTFIQTRPWPIRARVLSYLFYKIESSHRKRATQRTGLVFCSRHTTSRPSANIKTEEILTSHNRLKGLILRLVDLWLKQNCLGLPVSMLVKESRKWVENLWTLQRHWRKDTLIRRQRNERFWYFSLIPQDNKPGWYQFHSGPVSHYVDRWWQKRTFIWNMTALDRLSLTSRLVELKAMNPIFRRPKHIILTRETWNLIAAHFNAQEKLNNRRP